MKLLAHVARFAALAMVAAVLPAASAFATPQDRTRFKPSEHLEGYDEAMASEYELLYSFDRFEREYGEFVSESELSDLQAAWKAQRERVTAEIEAIETDPKEAGIFALRKELLGHRFFQVVDYTRVDGPAQIVFFVASAYGDDRDYEKETAQYYGGWLAHLVQIFEREYVVPLELERRADHPAHVVCVLASQGSYSDYARTVHSPGLYLSRAHYNPELQLSVTYTDPFFRHGRSEERRAALHELVHALQHSYHAREDGWMPVWFQEGLAEYLSAHQGLVPEALDLHQVDGQALLVLQGIASNRSLADVLLLPLVELAGLADYQAAHEHFQERARELGGPMPPTEAWMSALYAQSSLWMHYLHQGDGGRYRDPMLAYVRSVLNGKGSVEDLRAAFQGVEPDELERGFRRYVNAYLDGGRLMSKTRPLSGWEAPAPATAPVSASFSPGRLAPDVSDPEVALLLALGQAAEGRFGAAAAGVHRLLDDGDVAGDERERLQRELERIEGMIDLRRRFLEHLKRRGKKLNLMLAEDRRLLAEVEAVDDQRVQLSSNRQEIDALQLDAIDPVQLADLMRNKRKYGFEARPEWLVAYPYVLNGDDLWERVLSEGDPGAEALRDDARSDYPGRMDSALAACDLVRLSEAGAPANLAEGREVIADIRSLLARSGASDLVRDKRSELAGLAARAFALEFEVNGLSEVLNGEVEEKPDGFLRLVYEFEEPHELADFLSEPLHEEFNSSSGRAFSPFAVRKGALRANGFSCTRHVLSFRSRTRVSWRFRLRPPNGSYDPSFLVLFGMLDDGFGSFAASAMDGSLQVYDVDGGFLQRADSRLPVITESQWYTLEMEFDGEDTIATKRNGKDGARVASGPRKQGAAWIWSSCDLRFDIDRVEIEGTVVPASVEALQAGWIEERVRDLGL